MSTQAARIPKAERTRRQILAAAERRFAEAGFENTRLDDIAEDIGMVGSAILYHFRDKRELYRAVRDDLARDLLATVEQAVAGDAAPRERLIALVRASAQAIAARPGLASIALREAMASDPGVERRTNPLLQRIVALFEEGVRSGDIQPVRNEPYHFFSAVAVVISGNYVAGNAGGLYAIADGVVSQIATVPGEVTGLSVDPQSQLILVTTVNPSAR